MVSFLFLSLFKLCDQSTLADLIPSATIMQRLRWPTYYPEDSLGFARQIEAGDVHSVNAGLHISRSRRPSTGSGDYRLGRG